MPDPGAVLPNGSLQAHVLSYSAQDHLPRDSTSHNGLNPLTFISYQIHSRDSLRNSHLLADFVFAPSHFWNAPSTPPLGGTLSGNRDAEVKIALVWGWGGRMAEGKLEEDGVENQHFWPWGF